MTFECHYNEENNEKSCLLYTGARFLLSVEMGIKLGKVLLQKRYY